MTRYTIADAEQELLAILDKAPAGAIDGEWEATTMQAGTSSRAGGFRDRQGHYLDETSAVGDTLEAVIEKLEAGGGPRFNVARIRWTKAAIPWTKGKVEIETRLDANSVPRAPDDPVYDAAARARRAYWSSQGMVEDNFAAERPQANIHGQTKWFNPHRRILHIRTEGGSLLATDGLSTPWAGIADKENGVECEVLLALDDAMLGVAHVAAWADLMIGVGDILADGHRVAGDVARHGAIVFCRTGDDFLPLSRIVLSRTDGVIEGLPFGPVAVIRATAIEEADLAGGDPDEAWDVTIAHLALARRGIAV